MHQDDRLNGSDHGKLNPDFLVHLRVEQSHDHEKSSVNSMTGNKNYWINEIGEGQQLSGDFTILPSRRLVRTTY